MTITTANNSQFYHNKSASIQSVDTVAMTTTSLSQYAIIWTVDLLNEYVQWIITE